MSPKMLYVMLPAGGAVGGALKAVTFKYCR